MSQTLYERSQRWPTSAFACIHVYPDESSDTLEIVRLFQKETILEGMPDGVALLNVDNSIVWANDRLRKWIVREMLKEPTSTRPSTSRKF